MANCHHCDTALPGRRQVCDDCKAKGGKRQSAPVEQVVDGCDDAQFDPEDAPAAPTHPSGLHRRGRELWTALGQHAGTMAGELALEACRQADRLDELDRIIAGKGVLQLMQFRLADEGTYFDGDDEQHVHIHVTFQSVLSEARMQQVAFKETLKALRVITAPGPATTAGGSAPTPTPQPAATGLDEVMRKRQQREQASG